MAALLEIGLSNALMATLLAVVTVAVGSIYRRPPVIHGLLLPVFLKLVTPPLFRVPVSIAIGPQQDASDPSPAPALAESSRTTKVPEVADAELQPPKAPPRDELLAVEREGQRVEIGPETRPIVP